MASSISSDSACGGGAMACSWASSWLITGGARRRRRGFGWGSELFLSGSFGSTKKAVFPILKKQSRLFFSCLLLQANECSFCCAAFANQDFLFFFFRGTPLPCWIFFSFFAGEPLPSFVGVFIKNECIEVTELSKLQKNLVKKKETQKQKKDM